MVVETVETQPTNVKNTSEQIGELFAQAYKTMNSDLPESLNLTRQVLEIAEKYGDRAWLAKIRVAFAMIYTRLADYNEALSNGQNALQLYVSLGDREGEARACNLIANVYNYLSDYAQALEYYLKVFAICEQIGIKEGMAVALENIALTNFKLDEYETALSYYQKAVALGEEMNNRTRVAKSLAGVGRTYLKLGQPETALDYLSKALSVATEINDTTILADIYVDFGEAYQHLQQFQESLNYLTKGFELYESLNMKAGLIESSFKIGKAYFKLEDYIEAGHRYHMALSLADQVGERRFAYQTHLAFSELYEAMGEISNALYHYKLYNNVKDEVIGSENKKAITSMQIRFNVEQAEKEKEIFRLRNVELAEANREIASLNDLLKAENVRMSAELDVTRRLQQMVLPREEELRQVKGLEIAPYMQPANEVGGDYYDILMQDGQVKIGIGDVTGHGLESGVLMLMVQTAVRSLLTAKESDPLKFLTTINQAIYKNVQRMHSDKNLTLLLLDYHEGEIQVTGQHEEIILMRNNGDLELIDTLDLGFPIALEEDIEPFVASRQLKLEKDDTIVLYTDGITEAENNVGVQYGLERLCEVVKTNHTSSAETLKDIIISDVMAHIGEHEIYDDITLLVLKQTN